jgi:hypothetical protein
MENAAQVKRKVGRNPVLTAPVEGCIFKGRMAFLDVPEWWNW